MRHMSTEAAVTKLAEETQPKIFGQTKATWFVYWICAVASIANLYGENCAPTCSESY